MKIKSTGNKSSMTIDEMKYVQFIDEITQTFMIWQSVFIVSITFVTSEDKMSIAAFSVDQTLWF